MSASFLRTAREVWHATERTWIGVSTPPLTRRLEDAGWTPDGPDDCCPRCARDTGPFEARRDGCPRCRDRRLPWSRAVRLGRYEGVLRDIVHDVKFTAWRSLGTAVGRELGRAVGEAIAADPDTRGRAVIVVPVPTTLRRRLARGIDHTMILARAVAGSLERGRVAAWLRRTHRPSQLAVPASSRARNVAGSIRLKRGGAGLVAREAGAIFVLVDDVTTTGSTLRAAAVPLAAAMRAAGHAAAEIAGPGGTEGDLDASGQRLWVATVAVTPERRERGQNRESR